MHRVFLANSTFLLLFLKDIRKPSVLLKIGRCVKLITTVQVLDEVERKLAKEGFEHMIAYARESVSRTYDALSYVVRRENPLIVHEPFLGAGEFSIIAVFWYLQYRQGVSDLYIITDDKSARKYIIRNIPEIPKNKLLWSLRFIEKYALFRCNISPKEFLEMLDLIEKSSFRVDREILEFYRRKYLKCGGNS